MYIVNYMSLNLQCNHFLFTELLGKVEKMMDSVQLLDSNYARQLQSKYTQGRLHKGHSIAAASASIPSKYQTVVLDNSDRKGFGARAKRFNYEAGDNPGPGNYLNHTGMDKVSSSYSKKGTGGFASKARRAPKHESTCGPGAAAYGLPSLLTTKKDYNKMTSTSSFHKPIAVQKEKPGVPAPNNYEVNKSRGLQSKNSVISANAAFKSQSKREVINVNEASKKPAPCHYQINDELTRDRVKVPESSFKSKTKRQIAPDSYPNPGPGTYKPHEPTDPANKQLLPRKHYLGISAPAMPLPPGLPNPGPGSYELVNYEGPMKHYMSSSQFVSNTSRWAGDVNTQPGDHPGPAHYHPQGGNKTSFIYNASSRWI
ncbi:unnamed protein product [Owenia fusiformis]|uniref:O(6)-methylguanine-induced apoptosis 2 n=1 Tax=Owenia fusiformis TaxID=6347 RepID=A0A8S4N555_OWEFU|nr:unnamed protein product [Owenia fusiformis]